MLGLAALWLTIVMIYTLIKNALQGKQLNSKDQFSGTISLIIPFSSQSEFYEDLWRKNLSSLSTMYGKVEVHFLFEEDDPLILKIHEISKEIPIFKVHTFSDRPLGRELIPWMLEVFSKNVQTDVVIIGDSAPVPTESAFSSLGKIILEDKKPLFVLPQTNKQSILGESVAALDPNLALASFFSFKKIRRNITYPLFSISEGWMSMTKSTFHNFDWSKVNVSSWKEGLCKTWEIENKSFMISYGERHLVKPYPEKFKDQVQGLMLYWDHLWFKGDRTGFWFYLISLFIWSFPILCFFSHPFWSLASFCLLFLFRVFTKIIFQQTWASTFLHPVACIIRIGTFLWWAIKGLKSTKGKNLRPLLKLLRNNK